MIEWLSVRQRFFLATLLQVLLVVVSLVLAFALRFDFNPPPEFRTAFWQLLPSLVVIKLVVFLGMKLYSGWWRYVSLADVLAIFKANMIGSLAVVGWAFMAYRLEFIPRSVLLLDGILCFGLMCGVRFLTRAVRENYFPMLSQPDDLAEKVVIYGAGAAGIIVARELRGAAEHHKHVVGFIDDDPKKARANLYGYPVLGTGQDLNAICLREEVFEVILAMPSATGRQIRRIVDSCKDADIHFRILPSIGELINGTISLQQIRDVKLDDLLGREPIRLDTAAIAGYLSGKRILVTGAGGSIGSEICRQIAGYGPAALVLLDQAETSLFFIDKELRESHPGLEIIPVIGNIRRPQKVQAVFAAYRPEVVFHAAAYKHVPMMEGNPGEAVSTNVHGTRILANLAHDYGVRNFVMISTDKAVNPTNVMGTSKRVAEIIVQTLSRRSATHFVTVRFGNVLGSSGSVVPIFRDQIANGGPVTVTHPDVTRFFMTIPEATQLVLQAGSMGKGGEIFLLDMGEPVKIVTLAEEMIRLSGYEPYEDIDISFIGLRPGEKLFEELLLSGEGTSPTPHEKIMVAQAVEYDEERLMRQTALLMQAAEADDHAGIRRILGEIVTEYHPADQQLGVGGPAPEME